ncbi:unnamed protein product [Spirodela intermedia]|uniref:Uncharacterized protein n=1 Tax=Spirodela intermedia TaxID=51605 RepID=A0A7I8I7M8_SPIIN|nr:unnamed protein product [Spirodela intermedia]CAA6653454.1 unnamed protein product [Spirodela intermedia]
MLLINLPPYQIIESSSDITLSHYFLSIELTQIFNGFSLSQTKYITSPLHKVKIEDYKPLSTPYSTSPSQIQSSTLVDYIMYQSLVGALQFVTITRPDIAFVINKVCQKIYAPTTND